MKGAYYNEIDPYAAQWLRNLIVGGHIARGDVDERSIADVRADDIRGYTQAHFFAGIGGWPAALRLAKWPDEKECWTGSCPCQPLSVAGQRRGHVDERHLWPAFYKIIAQRRPSVVFGEQVSGADGREWLAAVRADLEAAGYACGAADLCAAGVASPQNRSRLYWVGDARGQSIPRPERERESLRGVPLAPPAEHGDGGLSAWLYDCENPDSISALDGIRRPVASVRAFGLAIVPQIAAEFVAAFMSCEP